MHGAITPLPNTSSWRGAKLNNGYVFMVWYLVKHRDNFAYLYLSWNVDLIKAYY
jgi:hypothetical protein